MIQQWLGIYQCKTHEDVRNALREIMQEIALAGLYRSGFFKHASFYGGTALRIFHGLPRYSEDLDFSLLAKDENFRMKEFLLGIEKEFNALGIQVRIEEKTKRKESAIESAFLKSTTIWNEINLESLVGEQPSGLLPSIKIKVEVDTLPPLSFETENKLLIRPYSFFVSCFTLPSLFAGKMHALLFRAWGERVKGRDWFDFEWYVKQGVRLDVHHFHQRAIESGDYHSEKVDREAIVKLLQNKIESVNFERVKADIRRFVDPTKALEIEIWSSEYFKALLPYLKIT